MKKIIVFLLSLLFFFSCKKNSDLLPTPQPILNVPKLTTNAITDLTLFSVTLGGVLVDTGASKPIEIGIVVDTLPMPSVTKYLNKFVAQADNNGNFSKIIIDIPSNKRWYVRSYGINLQGAGYGNEVEFISLQDKRFFGDVYLTTQQEVNTFGSNNYTSIQGSLNISGPVTNLHPLSSLIIIDHDLKIQNTQITNFNGLENLEIIGNDGFGGQLLVYYNSSLINFQGLQRLKLTRKEFYIFNNNALINFSGLNSYRICTDFEISNCANLTSLTGLDNLQEIYGVMTLVNNPHLIDMSALGHLSFFSDRIYIKSCSSLTNLNGFENLKNIISIQLINNAMLNDINAIRNIDTITESIVLDNNDALNDISAFNNIKFTQFVTIDNNDALQNLEGLNNLQTIQYKLSIQNNSALINLQGLRRLKSLSSLEINTNNSLPNLNGLDSLTTITDNSYSILISGNNQLQHLDGLKHLVTAEGSIQIINNPLLINFCGLKPLFMTGYSNYFNTVNNGINPSQTQIISSCP